MRLSARWVWAVFAIEAALLGGAALATALFGPPNAVGGEAEEWGFSAAAVVFPLSLLAYPFVGGLIAGRRRGNPIGWLLLLSGFAWAMTFAQDGIRSLTAAGVVGELPFVPWVGGLGWWVLGLGLTATIALQVFPDGRVLPGRWRHLYRFSWAVIVVVFFVITVAPPEPGSAPNPYDVDAIRPIGRALSPLLGLLPLTILASAVSLVVRYRRAGADERQQIKWLGFTGAGMALVYAVTVLLSVVTEGPEGFPAPVSVMQSLTLVSYGAVPAAIGVAVLRYRLYDIDRIISRTLTYALSTGLLVGAYLGLVLGLGGVARSLTGSTDVAVAASTLAVAAAFRPVLRRVRARIDHRFNRARYDAARTIEAFAGRLRDEVDIDTLGAELQDVVGRTMQPSSVSLWVRVTPRGTSG